MKAMRHHDDKEGYSSEAWHGKSRKRGTRKVATRKTSVAARPARANVIVRAAATERKFNFSAGPACLPLDVLEEMKEDLVNYKCVFPASRRTPCDVSSF